MDLKDFKTKIQENKTLWVTVTIVLFLITLSIPHYCAKPEDRSAEAVNDSDSLPMMHALGVNTLISDSGMLRYHMVTEQWDIYLSASQRPTWIFIKGILMERFDENFHIDLFMQADTAYFHQQKLWELRGRVVIRNIKDEVFKTEELFWDLLTHEIWSHKFMRITTPDRELQGTEFRSNEYMTMYSISNSSGFVPMEDTQPAPILADTLSPVADTAAVEAPATRQPMSPHRRGQLPPPTVPSRKFEPAPDKR